MKLKIRSIKMMGLVLMPMFLTSACLNPNRLPAVRSAAEKEEARISQETDEAIKKSPALQELDNVCTKQVPPAVRFVRINRHLDYAGKMVLVYGYHSQADFATVKQEYKNQLIADGWNVTMEEDVAWGDSRIAFANGNYAIRIYHVGVGQGINYKIHCEKLRGNQ